MDTLMLVVAFVVGIAIGLGVQQLRVSNLKTTIATMEKDQATALANAKEDAREALAEVIAKNQDLQDDINHVSKTAKVQQDAISDRLSAARDESQRLREEIDRRQARDRAATSEAADAARQLAAARETNRVLTQLFTELDEQATTVAAFADRSHLAATSCKRSYESVKDYTQWP